MTSAVWTTKCKTADGRVFDLGSGQRVPHHPQCKTACPGCLVVNAWTEPRT